jgi:hypothetical protein
LALCTCPRVKSYVLYCSSCFISFILPYTV